MVQEVNLWISAFKFYTLFLKVLEVGHPKNVIIKLEAQLLNEIILLSCFKLNFWIPWVLKPLSSNFQQCLTTTDKEIKDLRKF